MCRPGWVQDGAFVEEKGIESQGVGRYHGVMAFQSENKKALNILRSVLSSTVPS